MISPIPPSDYVLLRRFAFDDDGEAFEELVRRHAAMARAVCRRVLGPAGDADDAAQTAFLSLMNNARPLADRLGPTGSLAGWLYRVAVNASLQQRRASKARRLREAKVVRERDPQEGVFAQAEHSELLVVLDEELKELPSRYRTPLVLCHLEGKTQHEAAEQLGLSYGTLRRRLDRGRKLLKARIGRRGVVATSALLALVLKSSAAQAATDSTAFIAQAVAATRSGASPVTLLRPRVMSSGRVPQTTPRTAGSISSSVYAVLLGMIVVAAAIPPVVGMLTPPPEQSTPPARHAPSETGPSNLSNLAGAGVERV